MNWQISSRHLPRRGMNSSLSATRWRNSRRCPRRRRRHLSRPEPTSRRLGNGRSARMTGPTQSADSGSTTLPVPRTGASRADLTRLCYRSRGRSAQSSWAGCPCPGSLGGHRPQEATQTALPRPCRRCAAYPASPPCGQPCPQRSGPARRRHRSLPSNHLPTRRKSHRRRPRSARTAQTRWPRRRRATLPRT